MKIHPPVHPPTHPPIIHLYRKAADAHDPYQKIWRHAAASAAEAQALNRRAPSVPKQEAQELLHAVEELYFYRRYDEAVAFVGRVLEGRDGDGDGVALLLDGDVRDVLRSYEAKCLVKMGRS